jgi:hypothetical protein
VSPTTQQVVERLDFFEHIPDLICTASRKAGAAAPCGAVEAEVSLLIL